MDLRQQYEEAAKDREREAEAREWRESLIGDVQWNEEDDAE